MKSFCVEISTQTASFRNPEFQNFHKTLDLPPPTTIIGLAGAALGLSAKAAQEFFDNSPFKIGITGFNKGRTTDTWKYNKRTSGMHMYHPLLDGSVIKRELLIDNQFILCFLSDEEEASQKLYSAFENPVFALSMGNSDSLAKVKKIESNISLTRQSNLKNCLVAGDVVGEVLRNASKNLNFSIYQTTEPITYDLPTRFNYSSDYGKRTVADISTFSFIGHEMQLNYDVEGALYENNFIPIFDL